MSKTEKFTNLTSEMFTALKKFMADWNVQPIPPAVQTPPATPTAKFGEATAKDGTVIKWEGEQLAVGVPVMVIDPANPTAFLPAPDGDIELSDGTKITLKEGKVEVLTPATPANPAPAMPEMAAQFEKVENELKAVTEQFAKVKTERDELETKLKAEIESNKKAIESLETKSKAMFEMFIKAFDMPQGEPTIKKEEPKKVKKGLFEK